MTAKKLAYLDETDKVPSGLLPEAIAPMLPNGRTNVGVTVAVNDPAGPGPFPMTVTLNLSGLGSNAGGSGDEDDRFAIINGGASLDVPNDAWFMVQVNNLQVTNPNTVPALELNSDGIVNGQQIVGRLIGADLYRFDGQILAAFPPEWASGDGVDSITLTIANADENVAVGGNTYVQVTSFSPPVPSV